MRFFFSLVVMWLAMISWSDSAYAGIYDADSEETYVEYWIPHSEFTGGFKRAVDPTTGAELNVVQAGCPDNRAAGGSWYLEAWPRRDIDGNVCQKTVVFYIEDDFGQALKAELYFDLWRNQNRLAQYQLNGGQMRRTTVGNSWSRTPEVAEIPLTELRQGENTLVLETSGGGFHIHDMAVRIYFDATHPLFDENGDEIEAPTGSLVSIQADNGTQDAASGGDLIVNTNELVLTANVTSDATFVEFHGFYEGQDEDNDGVFRDWHNRGRNNWYPGGAPADGNYDTPPNTGGTIDHVGTKLVNAGVGNYSTTWQMAHVHNQADVRFKIRLVKLVGNLSTEGRYIVREAAGGPSAEFNLKRNRAVMSFIEAGFSDFILCHKDKIVDGEEVCRYNVDPDDPKNAFRSVNFDLPISPAPFNQAYFLGSYWKNPSVAINNNSSFRGVGGFDIWEVGIQSRSSSELVSGRNSILYEYTGGFGQFVENPGPMIVLAQTSAGSDDSPPTVVSRGPTGAGAALTPEISVTISEMEDQLGVGIDRGSIELRVNDVTVEPNIEGFANQYTLSYTPSQSFDYAETVEVEVAACDLDGRCMTPVTYSFTTLQPTGPFSGESDDFNACDLNARWTWIDPQSGQAGESSFVMDGLTFEIRVPEGTEHDVWVGGNNAPRIMQAVNNGDFEIEAKFDSSVSQQYQLQGFIIEQDSDNYLRLNFGYDGTNPRLFAARFVNGSPAQFWAEALPSGSGPLYLRLQRQLDQWQASYSYDGIDWTGGNNLSFTHSLVVTQIGLFAGNAGGNPAHNAVIDYFFNLAEPIDPEDGVALRADELNIEVSPDVSPVSGSVSVVPATPSQSDPACGSPLRLTATPASGWEFAFWEWDGGTAEENVYEREFAPGETVVANFSRQLLSLEVDIVSQGDGPGGSVTVTPEGGLYESGEEVTLTAVPNPGWTFTGWSGDVTGTELTESVSITRDKVVFATFVQNQYTLAVTNIGMGDGVVISNPSKATYVYGEQVSLQAVPANGSDFGGWSGDLPAGTDPLIPSLLLTITEDTEISAAFTTGYVLGRTVVGQGAILASPDKVEYDPDEVVTLLAQADAGWSFAGWIGMPSDQVMVNPVLLIMEQDMSVIANFVERIYTMNVSTNGTGTVSRNPIRAYRYGDEVTLSAVPGDGWEFAGWSGAISGNATPYSVNITDDIADATGIIAITANFVVEGSADHVVFLPFVTKD